LLGGGRDLHAQELAVEPDVDIEVTGILVEMQECPGSAREVTALALPQLGKRGFRFGVRGLTPKRRAALSYADFASAGGRRPSSAAWRIGPV
jgi:hypothetical protein